MFSLQMSVTMPFTTEEAQTTYQTAATTAIKTLTVASMYKSGPNNIMVTQGQFSMVTPESSAASALTVVGAAALALLSTTF